MARDFRNALGASTGQRLARLFASAFVLAAAGGLVGGCNFITGASELEVDGGEGAADGSGAAEGAGAGEPTSSPAGPGATTGAGPSCGDATCGPGENCVSCSDDCGPCAATCGDATCQADESCVSCPQDCGACPAECGNAACESGEDC